MHLGQAPVVPTGDWLRINSLHSSEAFPIQYEKVRFTPLDRFAPDCHTSRAVTSWRYSNSFASFRRTYHPAIHRPRAPNGRAYSTRSSRKQAEGPSGSNVCVCFQYANGPETLDVRKIAADFEVLMFRDPPPPEWPSPKLKHNARAAFDSAGFFNHFHVFPGRREPLQCARQGMPRIHLGGGSVDSRTANKCFGFHAVLTCRNSMRNVTQRTKFRRRALADCTICRCTGPGLKSIQYRELQDRMKTPESKVNRTIPEISRGEYGPFI